MAEEPHRIRNINISIIVGIGGIHAIGTCLAQKEVADHSDRIGNIDNLIFIDVTANEAGIVGVSYASSLTFDILFRGSFVATFVSGFFSDFVVGVVGIVGLVIISFSTDRIEPGVCIFRRNTVGFNRRIKALTDAFTVRFTSAVAFATSRRPGAFTIVVVVAPAATIVIVVSTVVSTTLARVGTVIATTPIASTAVIPPAAIVTAANSRQGIECRSQNDISIAIDYAEIGSCERVYIDIIFTSRTQLERAASGSSTFTLGRDTSQGCSIFTSHNLVDGFGLETIDANHRLLGHIPYGCQDDQTAGTGFALGALSAFRPFIALGTLTAITTSASPVFIFFFSIFAFSIVAFSIVANLGASRLTFTIIGLIGCSYLFFFGHGRRRQPSKTDSKSRSLIIFGFFNCHRILAAFDFFLRKNDT